MAITETWLNSSITDAQIEITGYNTVRSDRIHRRGGGVLLYIQSSLVHTNVAKFSDGTCESVVCTIENMDAIVAIVYRPPNASVSSFGNMLRNLSVYIDEAMSSKYMDVHIMGDVNLPNIEWENYEISKTLGEEHTKSASMLLNFMSDMLLNQIINNLPAAITSWTFT